MYFTTIKSQFSDLIFTIKAYTENYKEIWNEFVAISKNATFLFYRDFMEYHQDKFEDASMLIFKNEKLIALFPANKINNKLYSHQGLTYGGLLLTNEIKLKDVLEGFKSLLENLNSQDIDIVELKQIPPIYYKNPSDELQYLMFLLNAKLIRRDTLSVVNLKNNKKFSKDRIQGIKRAQNYNLEIKEVQVFDDFWNKILIPNLKQKHAITPVHSLEEITLLKEQFPNNIRQFNVYNNDKIVAGTTVFETDTVAHSQYISANNEKNILGSLDALHSYLIKEVFAHKLYFDFGVSNENKGRNINEGLQYWKEGFNAQTITQDFYEIETKNSIHLNSVML